MRLIGLASLSLFCAITNPLLAGFEPGPKVLYLGDSMSMGAFGTTFDEEMRESGCKVFTHVAGGATPYYWLSRYSPISSSIGYWEKTPDSETRKRYIRAVPKVEKLVEQHRPDIVVVQTGTNLYATLRSKRRTKNENIREIEGLLQNMAKAATMHDADIYWITPPESHPRRYPFELQEEMASIMKRAVGNYGRVFDSRSVTEFTDPYPKTDGIHYGPTEAKEWGKIVADDFRRFLKEREFGRPEPVRKPILVASRSERPLAGLKRLIVKRAKSMDEELPMSRLAMAIPRATIPLEQNEMPKLSAPPAAIPRKAEKVEALVASKPLPEKKEAMPPARKKEPVLAESSPPEKVEKVTLMTAEPVETEWGTIVATLKLKSKSSIPHINNVTYDHGFALFEYEVVGLHEGRYPYKTIRIAETACFNRRRMPALEYEIGKVRALKLDPLTDYPNLVHWQMNDDLPLRPELPVYIPSMK